MSGIVAKIINDGVSDIRKLNFTIDKDKNIDLFEVVSKGEKGLFGIGKTFIIRHKEFSNSDEIFEGDSVFKCKYPFVEFYTKEVILSNDFYAKDIDELIHIYLIYYAKNLIDWNKKFIDSLLNESTLIADINSNTPTFFTNNKSNVSYSLINKNLSIGLYNNKKLSKEIEQTVSLANLYRSDIDLNDLWFNKHLKIYTSDRLNMLKILKTNLNLINYPLLEYRNLSSIKEIQKPKIDFFDRIFGSEKRILNEYDEKIKLIDAKKLIEEERNDQIKKINEEFLFNIEHYKNLIDSHLEKVSTEIEKTHQSNIINYEEGINNIFFFESVLRYSIINSFYDFQYRIDEMKDSKHLICDVFLPNDSEISKVKSIKEFKRDGRVEPIYYNDRDFKKIYDSVLYSIVFRLINEIYSSDYNCSIEFLTINGWVNILNKKIGRRENKCILSVSINRDQFVEIDFKNIDVKDSFRHLKGLSASSLIDFVPIAPLIDINKNDKRFIQSEEVLNSISHLTNIAAINWEDFEHLVRELFEKEFAVNGGEVKVTQSSRDGGVDAIAFDPDPIRGGKIVIQSKRYTNVVGVSAIRDLYGTVMNEGAMKGIIITTSHYGNDAHEFAKGKPLTLLDGNNLLFLLEKHGYKAKIDIVEAKNILNS